MSKPYGAPHLSPSEKVALLYILKNGPTYAYHLGGKKEKIFTTEKTANTALNSLARKRLLEKKVVENTRDRKDYYLTLKGLCTAFAYSAAINEIWETIESITDRWGHLLPILNKFSLFRKHGLGEQFKELVTRAVLIHYTQIWEKETAKSMSVFPRYFGDIEEYMIQRFQHMPDVNAMVKWNRILHEDEELRRKTKFQLKIKCDSYKSYLSEIEERLEQVFPLLENADPDWDKIREIEIKLARAHITPS